MDAEQRKFLAAFANRYTLEVQDPADVISSPIPDFMDKNPKRRRKYDRYKRGVLALTLREQNGLTFREIGSIFGVSTEHARKLCVQGAEFREQIAVDVRMICTKYAAARAANRNAARVEAVLRDWPGNG